MSQTEIPCFNNNDNESLILSFNGDANHEYKKINENLGIVRDVIRNLVPLGAIKVAENIIIEPVVDYVFESCKRDPNMVFVTLYYARGLQEIDHHEGDSGGPALRDMRKKRIDCSELLARELVHKFNDQELLFTKVLTKRYAFSQYEDISNRKNALDLAIKLYSEMGNCGAVFLSDNEVQACVYALWSGHLIPRISCTFPTLAVIDYYIPRHNLICLENFKNLELLNIPRNQYLLDVFAYIMFLIIYTMVAANYDGRREFNSPLEGSMYLLVFSFILHDIRTLKKHGIKEFLYFRRIISVILHIILATDFILRIKNLTTFQPIGRWLTQISRILKKSMSYYILLALAYIAFFQSFLVLENTHKHHAGDDRLDDKNEWNIFTLLIKGILNAPDFPGANRIENRFGFVLYSVYVFTVSVILFAVLLPLFMTAFTTRRTVPEEYLAHFALIVIRKVRHNQPTRYNYPAPFNFLYYTIVVPISSISFIIRQNHNCLYPNIEKFLTRIIFFIPMIVFALIETHFVNDKQDKEARDLDLRELPGLPFPEDEKQMLRRILHGLDSIKEQYKSLHSRLETIESQLT
ncbi:20420_t:CDS:2 [Funneliformis geosporum]|uniref:7093_t:CDS:1 n=1 Tax=Funneliformis geosporum TaxID=1117311 RepID=A0A9W4SDH4_9GLOM|nr:20420_t:CDS:2 [Funneliformis geosporum]CAI2165274.1 7093_t:CDS:2 [Funneliformis geosporum]